MLDAYDAGGDPAWQTTNDDQDGYGDGEQPGDEVGRDVVRRVVACLIVVV